MWTPPHRIVADPAASFSVPGSTKGATRLRVKARVRATVHYVSPVVREASLLIALTYTPRGTVACALAGWIIEVARYYRPAAGVIICAIVIRRICVPKKRIPNRGGRGITCPVPHGAQRREVEMA